MQVALAKPSEQSDYQNKVVGVRGPHYIPRSSEERDKVGQNCPSTQKFKDLAYDQK